LPFWLSFRAQRANLLSPVLCSYRYLCLRVGTISPWLYLYFSGDMNKKRETAGSLAALGMTTRKAKAKAKATAIPNLRTFLQDGEMSFTAARHHRSIRI
jgi:hypothetical protein